MADAVAEVSRVTVCRVTPGEGQPAHNSWVSARRRVRIGCRGAGADGARPSVAAPRSRFKRTVSAWSSAASRWQTPAARLQAGVSGPLLRDWDRSQGRPVDQTSTQLPGDREVLDDSDVLLGALPQAVVDVMGNHDTITTAASDNRASESAPPDTAQRGRYAGSGNLHAR